MVSSTRQLLFAILQLRSTDLRRKLRAFVQRCLLFWPRILCKLRELCSWYFKTSFSDGKKTEGNTGGPSSTGTLWKHEEYSVVCASRAFEGVGGPSLTPSLPRLSDAEERGDVIGRSPSVPHSPSSSYLSSLQGSPRHSATSLHTGDNYPSSSLRAGSPHGTIGTMELVIHRSNTPVSWTHPHATSRQFTGASSHRPRSRSRSPFRRRSSRHNTPTILDTGIPMHLTMTQSSQGSPEVSAHSGEITFQFENPSPPGSPITSSSSSPRRSSIHNRTQSLPTHQQVPSTESVNSSPDSSRSTGHSPSVHGAHRNAHRSRGSIQAGFSSPQVVPAPLEHSLASPQPSISRIQVSVMNASHAQRGLGRHSMKPMHSEQVSRYRKMGDVQWKDNKFKLKAMVVHLPNSYRYPYSGDWIPITHPGGALYFYHNTLKIFTDVYMYDPDLREHVHKFAELLEEKVKELRQGGIFFPTTHYDLVLDIVETEDKETIWQYYYVDHQNKTLFWSEDYRMKRLLYAVPGVEEPGHIKRRLESLYWLHWSLYPVGYEGRKFPDDASDELLGVLLSSSIDSLTSKVSTAPYSVADMQTMRGLIKEAKDFGTQNAHAISSIARLHSICTHWKFMHFHGQRTSRLNRHKTIYEDGNRKRTILIQLLSPILFYAPHAHLRELSKVWADEVVIKEVWKNFMERLVSEWVEFVLYSTVMLAVNVGFLAIQGVIVVPQSNGWIDASAAQIASSISLGYSIGSIITGLLLIRRNRTMAIQDTGTAWDYLNSMKMPCVYLEPLAIIFSLTYALLMWSVCAFFTAVLLFTFQNTWWKIRVPVGGAASIVAALIIGCIISSWDSGRGDYDELIDKFEDEEDT